MTGNISSLGEKKAYSSYLCRLERCAVAELEENEHDSVVFVDSGAQMSKDSGLQCYRIGEIQSFGPHRFVMLTM